mgnify:FL=1
MKNKISILQNFIVTKEERLNTLKETLPPIANYFSDIKFYVNYNSKFNFEEVYSLYKNNINDLNFYNDLTMDWGKVVQSMLLEIETDYVFVLPEDFILFNKDTDYFNNLVEEFINYNCTHMIMHRVEDVKCYGTNQDYYHLYDSKEYLHLVESDVYPTSCLSSVAIYKKDFLNDFLNVYNNQVKSERFSLATPNCYEWFSHDRLSNLVENQMFAVPKKAVVQHYEPYKIKERKV